MRIGIVGASTLLGRELAEVIGETAMSGAEVVLLDEEEASGQITAVGDEPALIQRLERTAFEGMDLCFFVASKPEYLEMARDAGVSIVDTTDTLRARTGVAISMPWVNGLGGVDIASDAVIPAHLAAVLLGLVAVRCERLGLKSIAATILVPASEHGQPGLDEMQRQAVALLSFQPVPREEFDTQVAFNLIPSLGDAAKLKTADLSDRIRADYAVAQAGRLPPLALQIVHSPVFHGYALSILLEFGGAATAENVEAALSTGGHLQVVTRTSEPPSNLSATGQGFALTQVSKDTASRIWVWMAADNVRLAALHVIECGTNLQKLRSRGRVQQAVN